jgi:hypothetical protein
MITITDTDLEDVLKMLLQRRVEFIIHKKHWRAGRLLLFKQNGFYIEFTIRNDKDKNERFEVPIPFNVIRSPTSVKFSYELNDLVCNNPPLVDEIKSLEPNCRSKYFNSYMEIHIS